MRIETQCLCCALDGLVWLPTQTLEIREFCQSLGIIGIEAYGSIKTTLSFIPATLILQNSTEDRVGVGILRIEADSAAGVREGISTVRLLRFAPN